MCIYDAAERYRIAGTPLVIIAGKQYGQGSSRDWAAKGPRLLGVRAVLAESYERIHRGNLAGMGVLPLQFLDGQSAETLRLDGTEVFHIVLPDEPTLGARVAVNAAASDGSTRQFAMLLRLDTQSEIDAWRAGGVLDHVVERLLA